MLRRTDCQCIICQVGRAQLYEKVDVSEYTQVLSNGAKSEEALCPKCFSSKNPEVTHKCSSKRESVANLLYNMPQKLQEQLSSKVIKDKAIACGSKTPHLTTFGKPLQVSISPESDKKSFTHEDIISIKRDVHLSDRETLKMAQHFREETQYHIIFCNVMAIQWQNTIMGEGGMYK